MSREQMRRDLASVGWLFSVQGLILAGMFALHPYATGPVSGTIYVAGFLGAFVGYSRWWAWKHRTRRGQNV